MASLSEQAAAARREARRLREEDRRLREAVHFEVWRHHAMLLLSREHLDRAAELRARPLPSPWSGLRWRAPGSDLEDVLMAVPRGLPRRSGSSNL